MTIIHSLFQALPTTLLQIMIAIYFITQYRRSPGYWLAYYGKHHLSTPTNTIIFMPTVKETSGMATFIFSNIIILHTWWLRLYQVKYLDIFMRIEYLALRVIRTLWDIIMSWIPDDINLSHEILQDQSSRIERVLYWLHEVNSYWQDIFFPTYTYYSTASRQRENIITSYLSTKNAQHGTTIGP